jgi:transposase InsO family protein
MVMQGFTATLVAAPLEISRSSSLYYQKQPRGSRADRQYDEQIVVACGEKPAYGYRLVAWWLQRKENLPVNRKRVLRVMRERGLLVRSRRLRARRKKEWGRVEAAETNQIWQSDMFTSSRFLETLGRLGITHRRTAYHHPEGNSYIKRFHRSLKEEEVWTAEYRSLEGARASIGRWIEEYNHDRPHRGVGNRTPHEAFLAFAAVLKRESVAALPCDPLRRTT